MGYQHFLTMPGLSRCHVPQLGQVQPWLPPDPTKVLSSTSDPAGGQLCGLHAQLLQTQHHGDFCSSIHSNLKLSYQFKSYHQGGKSCKHTACSMGLIFFGNQAKYSGDCRVLGCVAHRLCQCHGETFGSCIARLLRLAHYLHGPPAPCSGLLPTTCYHSCPLRPHSKPYSACSSWMPILRLPCFLKTQHPPHLLSLLRGGPQVLAVSPWLKFTSQILPQGRRTTNSSVWSLGTVPVSAHAAPFRGHSENHHVPVAA